MKKFLSFIVFSLCFCTLASAQSAIVKDFMPVCDSLAIFLNERSGVEGELKLKNIMKRGKTLDFYFTVSLGDYPWRKGEPLDFRKQLMGLFPEKYSGYSLGAVYCKKAKLETLVTPELDFDGKPSKSMHKANNPKYDHPLVSKADGLEFNRGLEGRNIAVWQSHGKYFDRNAGEWIWQRPCLFQTVEDMFTQSFVLPYLVPMLENAGAYVMLPRERDNQRFEIISDFDTVDPAYGFSEYEEKGKWTDAGSGFAALKPVYTGTENPFRSGSVRKTSCVAAGNSKEAKAVWRPEIPERGEYAVYVSYKSFPESSTSAKYTVQHLGGESHFIVNQKIGGGTWIYLGTFEFAEGMDGHVSLSNMTPYGYKHVKGSIVTADAVKFGGGIGNIARSCPDSEEEPRTSGMPRSAEGARYWLQWAGADSTVFSQNKQEDDYKDDFMSRGDWVEWISRGSKMNPSKTGGMGIPVDLSFGFHSDAGITPNDSLVGTLAIYTLRSERTEKLPDGESRLTSREYADLVQSQVVNDLRAEFDSLWSRRAIWDRGYRESRTPSCPAMLLELLSHQNFADMKYGLDPSFRFRVSRAVYKGMLKYLSNRYGVPYEVQPLPVRHMGVSFGTGEKAVLTWKETEDPIEPTAKACGFFLYTRLDDGAFDSGRPIEATRGSDGRYSFETSVKAGHIYSFRIAAFNEGGLGFPSETVSIGIPSEPASSDKVLIVNNFDRVSAPAFIDMPTYAGFDNRLDSGVPHIRDIAYIGDMYEFRRSAEYQTNDNPGFGASFDNYAGGIVAGNSFDYPYVHGKAIMKAGYPFYSCSNEAFCSDEGFADGAWTVDLICGKQVTSLVGSSRDGRYQVFPEELQQALRKFTACGGHVLTSGSYIATDVWDSIYPVQVDSIYREGSRKFVREVLGYKWIRNKAGRTGEVRLVSSEAAGSSEGDIMNFHNEINPVSYSVESPDGIAPVSAQTGSTFIRYADTRLSAGVVYEGKGYRTVSLGFPIESLKEESDIDSIISTSLKFFSK